MLRMRHWLLAMMLSVQAVLYIYDGVAGWSLGYAPTYHQGAHVHQTAIYWCQQVVVSVYLVAALSKMWKSRFQWIKSSSRVVLQMVKTAHQRYHNELDDASFTQPLMAKRIANHAPASEIYCSKLVMYNLISASDVVAMREEAKEDMLKAREEARKMATQVTQSLGGEAGPNYTEYPDWAKKTGAARYRTARFQKFWVSRESSSRAGLSQSTGNHSRFFRSICAKPSSPKSSQESR